MGKVIDMLEWQRRRQAEETRRWYAGTHKPVPRRPTLDELIGWPPNGDDAA